MPDTSLLPIRRDRDTRTIADLIREERKPLPAHSLDGVSYRAWALAVCDAEVRHRGNDFARATTKLGIYVDHFADPDCEQWGQFKHEARAAEALIYLSYLQTHESIARWPNGPRNGLRGFKPAELAAWRERRRMLWRGFVASVEAYKAERALIDRPAQREAA